MQNITLSLLGVLFIGLKLTNQIDWSWLWVLVPFWGPIGLVAIVLVFMGITAALVDGKLTTRSKR